MRARKKPVEVEFVQWREGLTLASKAVLDKILEGSSCTIEQQGDDLIITTVVNGHKEGVTRAIPGDFIIKGVNGEVYPCKQDVFHKTYDILPEVPA